MNKPIDISKVIIHTERLTLRAFTQNDLNDLYQYAKVDGVGQMAGWTPHKNIAESQQILDMFISGNKTFAIEYQGKVIGSVGVEQYDEALLPQLQQLSGREIGYVLSKEYWGNGLMTEAVKAVIQYLFECQQLDFIAITHYSYNTRSQRVIQKCGFQYVKDVQLSTRYNTVEQSKLYILYNNATSQKESGQVDVGKPNCMHTMQLHASPFDKIADGSKTIELRLYDAKRKAINVGDKILFWCKERKGTLVATVKAMDVFDSFESLYKVLPLDKCGYSIGELATASAQDMLRYYTKEDIAQYGVVAIHLTDVAWTQNYGTIRA